MPSTRTRPGEAVPKTESPVAARLRRRGPWLLAAAWVVLTALGVVVLRLPGATTRGHEFSFERAVFTAVNASTLTGFQQTVALDLYGPTGKATVILLTIAGTFFALVLGGMALIRLLRLPYGDGQLIAATVVTWLFAVALGTGMLVERGRGLLASAMQAASAFGNSGLFLGRLPTAAELPTHAALLPLVVLGGLSIPVLMELYHALIDRRPISAHARTVLLLSAGVYLAGVALLSPCWRAPIEGTDGWSTAIAAGSALSIDSRSAGFPLASVGALARPGQWLLVLFMVIGAAPAGSGGGLHVTALFHGFRGTRRALRREAGLRITGIAATWIFTFCLLLLLTTLALLGSLPELAADRVVFLAASALGNVGLSHDPVALTKAGLWVVTLAMILGRAMPLLILWWAARTCDDADVGV